MYYQLSLTTWGHDKSHPTLKLYLSVHYPQASEHWAAMAVFLSYSGLATASSQHLPSQYYNTLSHWIRVIMKVILYTFYSQKFKTKLWQMASDKIKNQW